MPSLNTATSHVRGSCFSLYGQWLASNRDAIGFLLALDGKTSPKPADRVLETRSIGSAFAWSDDGLLVTCAHVVRGVRGFIAEDAAGNQFAARLVGFCTVTDVAVLKIEARTRAVEPSRYKALQGQRVFTLGHPLTNDLGFSLAAGKVAAVERFISGSNPIPHLQLDMSIYPGNSGGGLFNEKGELVGMVRGALIPDEDPASRVGFAADLAVLNLMVPRLVKNGHGHLPPDLGVQLSKLRPPLAKALNLPPFFGLQVDEVVEGSLARQSRLQPGDILTSINGIHCATLETLHWAMLCSIGKPLHLSVLRGGPSLVSLVGVPDVTAPALPRARRYQPAFGLTLSGGRKVRVLSVTPGSEAALSGLTGGEVLNAYLCPDSGNWTPIKNRKDVLALANRHAGQSLAFLITDTNGTVRQIGLTF